MELYTTEDLRPLLEYIDEKVGFSSSNYLKQNEIARTIWLCAQMDGQIKNGGVAQLFYNFRGGFDVDLFAKAFERIGSETGVITVNKFKEYLFESEDRKENFYTESFFGKGMTQENHAKNNELSDQYLAKANNVDGLILNYALKNWEDKDFQNEIKHLDFPDSKNETELVFNLNLAIESGNLSSIKKIVKTLSTVNQADEYGKYPFINIARIFNDDQKLKIDICELFLEKGADIHIYDRFGKTLLHHLAKSKFQVDDVIKYLIEKGANPNKPVNKEPVLTQAVDKVERIKTLLSLGADINLRGTSNISALGRALFSYNNTIDSKKWADKQKQLKQTISYLLENGASFHDKGVLAKNSTELSFIFEDINFLKEMIAYPASKNAPEFNNKYGIWNALFQASYTGNEQALEVFLQSGAPVDQKLETAYYDYNAHAGSNLISVAKNEKIEELLLNHGAHKISQQAFTVFMETRGDESSQSIIKELQNCSDQESKEKWETIPIEKGETIGEINDKSVYYKVFPVHTFDNKKDAEDLVKALAKHNVESIII